MMRQELMTAAFLAVMLLLIIWRAKSGYANGMMQELSNILTGAIALACVALVFLAVRSLMSKSMHTLGACVAALVLLGIAFKVCHLIFTPLLSVGSISVIGGINKFLGAVIGVAEAFLLAWFLYKALGFFGFKLL